MIENNLRSILKNLGIPLKYGYPRERGQINLNVLLKKLGRITMSEILHQGQSWRKLIK